MDSSRCYSQAVFCSDDEQLETAQTRKFDYAIESCRLKSGDRVLNVRGGWDSFTDSGLKDLRHAGWWLKNIVIYMIKSHQKYY